MSGLQISLLGRFRASLDGRNIDSFRTSKVQALLIYLVVEAVERPSGKAGREQLMTLLWPEMPPKSARDNLRQTLYRLRKLIPELPDAAGELVPFILGDRQSIWLNREANYRLDVATFTARVEAEEPEQLAAAVDLYRGKFLADFYLEDSNAFEEWVAGWRNRLRRQALAALDRLAETALAKGEAGEAAVYARRQLDIDDLRERGHRQLIRALGAMGRRAEAIRQYEWCRSLLEEELGVAPSTELEAVVAAIRRTRTQADPLPAPETPLIGREAELDAVTGLLLNSARLVSIVGPGGIGKTRLALAVARSMASLDADERANLIKRVIFVNLAPLSEADEVAPTVARALDPEFEEANQDALRQRLLDYLRDKNLLLVLDNYEHLLPEVALLKEILRAAPDVKMLVTSRERLRLKAEYVYPLSGLAYSTWTTPVQAARDPAVQLFLQQARRVRPAFRLRSEHLASLHEIVSLTQGMPLALILAAGWVTVLGPVEIAAELGRSLDLLEATHRDVPPRQRSMRAVFRATWERLSAREQAIFAALSVFRGGFALKAAQAVTGATPDDLMRLADHSLVTRVEGGRLEVHELLRQFAAERLVRRGEEEAVRHAHSAYFCAFLQQREDDLKGPRVDEATAEITADLDNVRAAWSWAANNARETLLGQAVAAFGLYADRRHLLQKVPARMLRASESLTDAAVVSPCTQAALLSWSTILFSFGSGPSHKLEQLARRALAFVDEAAAAGEDVREERAWAHLALGNSVIDDQERRLQNLETSLTLFSELGLRWEMAIVHERLAVAGLRKANYGRVREHYHRAQSLFEATGHRPFSLFMKAAGARVDAFIGRAREAETVLRDLVAFFEESGDRPYWTVTQKWLGEVLIYSGQFQEALSILKMIQELEMTWSNSLLQSNSRLLSIWTTLHEGGYREVQEEATPLLASARKQGKPYDIGLLSFLLGCAALAVDNLGEARTYLRDSIITFEAREQRDELGWARAGLGYVAIKQGNAGAGREHLTNALRYVPEYHHFACALTVLPTVALLFAEQDEEERAVELYALASRHGFVANSRWFEDLAGHRLAVVSESLTDETVDAARTRGEGLDLWVTSRHVLRELEGSGAATSN